MKLDLELAGSIDQAVDRLSAVIRAQAPTSVLESARPRLSGDVSRDDVMLIRRRGPSSWYGVFHGAFEPGTSNARLRGHFGRSSSQLIQNWPRFAVIWGVLLAVDLIRRLRAPELIVGLAPALSLVAVGAWAIWLRSKKTQSEAQLLREELAAILGEPGA